MNELELLKQEYPFEDWLSDANEEEDDDEYFSSKYTKENIDALKITFDTLIDDLIKLNREGSKSDYLSIFKKAVIDINNLADKNETLILTVEREDLCELFDRIANQVLIEDIEDHIQEWRNW